jgi:putative acetyltransferase
MPLNPAMQPGSEYTLRKASNADGPAVWTLIAAILRSYGITPNQETTDRDLTDIEANYWNRKGAFFVLLDGKEVIGTVALHHETDEVCELCRMYLAPQHRGQGLGRRLLDLSLREARQSGFKEMRLKTASVLVEAISLYKRAGFTPVEGAKACGNCDLVMRRSLGRSLMVSPPDSQ